MNNNNRILLAIIILSSLLCVTGCFSPETEKNQELTEENSTLKLYVLNDNQTSLMKTNIELNLSGYLAKNWTGNNENFYINEVYKASYIDNSSDDLSNFSYDYTVVLEIQLFKLNSSNISNHVVDNMRSFGNTIGLNGTNISGVGQNAYLIYEKEKQSTNTSKYSFYFSVDEILVVLKGFSSSEETFISYARLIEDNILSDRQY